MTEQPILFSGPMIHAILDSRKTQTRRVVKLPHDNPLGQWEPITVGGENGGRTASGQTVPLQGGIWHTRTGECLTYGQPGDRLWVRETFFAFGRWETRFSEKKGHDEWHFVDMTLESDRAYQYAADTPDVPLAKHRGGMTPEWWKRPAIFMPRTASRITLEILGVRVERLQDISERDAIAEGITIEERHKTGYCCGADRPPGIRAFRELWNSLNAARGYGWDANPYVWVISFQRIS